MASITIRLTETCSGGNHHTISVSGDISHTFVLDGSTELFDFKQEDIQMFVRMLIAFAKRGKTNQQVRTTLTNGVTVTL